MPAASALPGGYHPPEPIRAMAWPERSAGGSGLPPGAGAAPMDPAS